ncbi:hypothetical protein ACWGE1_39635, partial [Streptomyces sp. NPDC054932]
MAAGHGRRVGVEAGLDRLRQGLGVGEQRVRELLGRRGLGRGGRTGGGGGDQIINISKGVAGKPEDDRDRADAVKYALSKGKL